jgi:hypothetical protein
MDAVKIFECKINDKGHLIDKDNKLVLVQIGCEVFFLEPCLVIKGPAHLAKLLDKHHMVLLKEVD